MSQKIISNNTIKMGEPKDRTCFIIMRSLTESSEQHPTKTFDEIYKKLIVPIIEGYNRNSDENDQKGLYTYKCHPPESIRSGSITKYLLEKIVNSELVVADVTDRSPNIFLELGIRFYSKKSGTILICQLNKDGKKSEIPFYLHDLNIIFYSPDWIEQRNDVLKKRIEECIVAIEKNPGYYDSPVYIHNIADAATNYENLQIEKEKNKALNDRVQDGINRIKALEKVCAENNIDISSIESEQQFDV